MLLEPTNNLDDFRDYRYRPNLAEARVLAHRFAQSREEMPFAPDACPFVDSLDSELVLDAMAMSTFLSVHENIPERPNPEGRRLTARFLIAALVGEAVGEIVPGSNPVGCVGSVVHRHISRDLPSIGESVPVQESALPLMAWVETQHRYQGAHLLIDPMGWALDDAIKQDLPAFTVVGLRQNRNHLGSEYYGNTYQTGILNRSLAGNDAYGKVLEELRKRVAVWKRWKEGEE